MIKNREDFLKTLSDEQIEAGYIRFNIPDEDDIHSLHGEGVWGYAAPEEKEKYNDDSYNGKIKAILLNHPINYFGLLKWGDEVILQCHGENRPTIDPEWAMKNLKEEPEDATTD